MSGLVLHLFTSDRTARIPSMHYNGTGDGLKPIERIQDNAIIMSVFVPSELATCCTPFGHRDHEGHDYCHDSWSQIIVVLEYSCPGR
jgi:hypothetical protein